MRAIGLVVIVLLPIKRETRCYIKTESKGNEEKTKIREMGKLNFSITSVRFLVKVRNKNNVI